MEIEQKEQIFVNDSQINLIDGFIRTDAQKLYRSGQSIPEFELTRCEWHYNPVKQVWFPLFGIVCYHHFASRTFPLKHKRFKQFESPHQRTEKIINSKQLINIMKHRDRFSLKVTEKETYEETLFNPELGMVICRGPFGLPSIHYLADELDWFDQTKVRTENIFKITVHRSDKQQFIAQMLGFRFRKNNERTEYQFQIKRASGHIEWISESEFNKQVICQDPQPDYSIKCELPVFTTDKQSRLCFLKGSIIPDYCLID